MVGRALGDNVLDAMRAARQLAPEELPAGRPGRDHGLLRGWCGGRLGGAAAAEYAPELKLAGVAAGAAAADMELAGPTLDGSFFSFFLAYGAIGYAAAYPELELEPYLTAERREDDRGAARHATSSRRPCAGRVSPMSAS